MSQTDFHESRRIAWKTIEEYFSGGQTIVQTGTTAYSLTMSGAKTGMPYNGITYNIFDTSTNSTASGGNSGIEINYNITGGKGYKTGLLVVASLNAPTTNLANNAFYTGVFAQFYANSGDGGTGTTVALSKGDCYGVAGICVAQAGATNLAFVGNEFDATMIAGSSAAIKSIVAVVGGGLGGTQDNVSGTVHDSMVSCTTDSDTNVKYLFGISMGRQDSYWPIKSTGTLFGTSTPISGSMTAAYGIDLLAVTFSGAAFRSIGFSVSPTGAVTAGGATASASTAMGLPAGTTAISPMRIAHGVAPTSPSDGDMWTTSAGLFVRINGVTKTVTLT